VRGVTMRDVRDTFIIRAFRLHAPSGLPQEPLWARQKNRWIRRRRAQRSVAWRGAWASTNYRLHV